MIPGSGRSPGEGTGYTVQYSWVSLVAQLVKNPPAMQKTWVRSLGWEDRLEWGKGYPLQYSGLENSMYCTVHGVAKSRTQLSDFYFHDSVIQSVVQLMQLHGQRSPPGILRQNSLLQGILPPKDRTQVFCVADRIFMFSIELPNSF